VKVDLPSGAWIEMRSADELTAGDRTAMYEATELPVSGSQIDALAAGTGSFRFSIGMVEAQNYAVLARLITQWSYGFMLPSKDDCLDELGQKTYQDSLRRIPLDDWDVIEEAIAPHMARLRNAGPKGKKTITASSNGTSQGKDVVRHR
jgi:hypothetical protein